MRYRISIPLGLGLASESNQSTLEPLSSDLGNLGPSHQVLLEVCVIIFVEVCRLVVEHAVSILEVIVLLRDVVVRVRLRYGIVL